MRQPAVGEVFTVRFPFVRATVDLWDGDGDGMGSVTVPTWKPGTESEMVYPDDVEAVADGEGVMELTVVSVHKPGKYPTRVFYTRRFRTPDGKWFGKSKLRIATVPAFMRRAGGYWVEYEIRKVATATMDAEKERAS